MCSGKLRRKIWKRTSNQKYCSQECCRAETNRKTLAAYHKKRNRLRTTVRECLNCESRLSKYNEGDICQKCLLERNDISNLMSENLESVSLMILSEVLPGNVVGLDLSTRSMGFSHFKNTKLNKYGELFYEDGNFNSRLASIDKRVEEFAEVFGVPDLVVVESPVKVGSIQTTISLAYAYGIVMAKFAKRGCTVKTITPVAWQSFIGNKNFSKKETTALKRKFPKKSNSFYTTKKREIRKQRTIDWANQKFKIDLKSDNVADSVGIGYYGVWA